ncbi:hypothetical protein ACT6QG_02750 [Xanthobacter sp. TB0136]|uniref:hypothetical protein n=1 Tax=Xanthobacter sp. TB0136 TaxID=3459177 RepID=UPI00403A0D93
MMSALRVTVALFAALVLIVMAQPAAAQASKGHVYLFRGLGGVFSLGMDDLAKKLQERGIDATVYGHGSWPSVTEQAFQESRRNRNAPIMIVGHSLGADAAIQMAERLTALGTPPRLVVTFDPVGVTSVGPARGQFINYFQSNNGYGKRLTREKGFRGSLSNRDLAADTSIGHFSIEKSPQLHAEVINRVRAITAPRRPKPRPAPRTVARPKPPAEAPEARASAPAAAVEQPAPAAAPM